jgi:hypothetical protein
MLYREAASKVDRLVELAARAVRASATAEIRTEFGRIYGEVYGTIKDLMGAAPVTLKSVSGDAQYANAIEAAFIAGASSYESQGYLQLTRLAGAVSELADAAEASTPIDDLDALELNIVDASRLDELRGLASATFDTLRLVRLCEELNICFARQCFLAVSFLLRAVLDHVPAVFGQKAFVHVANNYQDGAFKDAMLHLQKHCTSDCQSPPTYSDSRYRSASKRDSGKLCVRSRCPAFRSCTLA